MRIRKKLLRLKNYDLKNLLIIGRIPPPIGGVTIHTLRLLQLCDKINLSYDFYDLKEFNLYNFLVAIKKARIAHLHANHPILILLFSISCKLLFTKSIITIHGNLGTFNSIYTIFENLSVRICDIPILLNDSSLKRGKKLNKNSIIISAFIPPILDELLSPSIIEKIDLVKKNTQMVFCTNSFDFIIDRSGNEVYGIIPLIKFFNQNSTLGLILSDPKGNYLTYINKNKFIVGNNIAILSSPHSFYEVIKKSDCFIRNTTTDGDSLSIREALYLGKHVIATSCIDRPKGVEIITLGDSLSLSNSINKILKKEMNTIPKPLNFDEESELINLYKNLLIKIHN